MFNVSKSNTQLIARCTYNPSTHKVQFEDFSKYYSNAKD
nr:MAG TPA: hypothetical protein [Caudoviricetes sp.]